MSISARNILLSTTGSWVSEMGTGIYVRDISHIDSQNVYVTINLNATGYNGYQNTAAIDAASGELLDTDIDLFSTVRGEYSNNSADVYAAPAFSNGGDESVTIVDDLQWNDFYIFNLPQETRTAANADNSLVAVAMYFDDESPWPIRYYLYDTSASTLKAAPSFNGSSVFGYRTTVAFKGDEVFTLADYTYDPGFTPRPAPRSYPVSGTTYTVYETDTGIDALCPVDEDIVFFLDGGSDLDVYKLNTANTSLGWTRSFEITNSNWVMISPVVHHQSTVDQFGNLYVVGRLRDTSETFPDGSYVLKISADGEAQWCNYIYSTSRSLSSSTIKHDGSGNIVIAVERLTFSLPDNGDLTDRGAYFGDVYYSGPLDISQGTKTSGYNPTTSTYSFSYSTLTSSPLTPNTKVVVSETSSQQVEDI